MPLSTTTTRPLPNAVLTPVPDLLPDPVQVPATVNRRRYDLDALRAIALSLLILYHTAMAYVAEWGWHVKSSYHFEWLQLPMVFVNRWRMELLFLISGAALAFLARQRPALRVVRERSWRLLLPLLFGMLVVVPLQPYCQGVRNGLVEPGFGAFLLRYYTGGPWPRDAFDGWQTGYTWNHLWYLPYLWAYTVLWLTLRPLMLRLGGARLSVTFAAALGRLDGLALLVLPAVPLWLSAVVLQDRFPETHDFIHDGFIHLIYLTVFLYGATLANQPRLWNALERRRKQSLLGALAVFTIYRLLAEWLPDDASFVQLTVVRATRWSYCWLALVAILGFAARYLNQPRAWLQQTNEAIFPCYVLHQTLIVGLVYWLAPLHLGRIAEPALVLGGTVLGCWGLYVGVIRRSRWLRPLFGMRASPRA
jgi:glucan biosynthesis protein C